MRVIAAAVPCLALAFTPAFAQAERSAPAAALVAELHRRVNEYRNVAGCPELRWHEAAARVAESHSRDMATRDYFDHVSPEGIDLQKRLLAGGVTWRGAIAENIALTARGPDVVIELWIDSPPHRENLDFCDFTYHGLGLHRDRWTQVLLERPHGTGDDHD